MTLSLTFSQSFFRTKCLRTATIIVNFSDICYFEIKPEMRDVLAKMREISQNTIAGRLTPMELGIGSFLKAQVTVVPSFQH